MVEIMMPTCPDCGEVVSASLCQTDPQTQEAADAIAVMLLATHRKLAHAGPLTRVCQSIRAGWLPHVVGPGQHATWWYGRPRDDGFNFWRQGLTPSMSIVDRMPDDEAEAWVATLHPLAIELDRTRRTRATDEGQADG